MHFYTVLRFYVHKHIISLRLCMSIMMMIGSCGGGSDGNMGFFSLSLFLMLSRAFLDSFKSVFTNKPIGKNVSNVLLIKACKSISSCVNHHLH